MGNWKEVDHTADVAIWICADSLEDLFLTSAEAMFEMVAEPEDVPPSTLRNVNLEAMDREALLVDWLNELLYLHERDEIVMVKIVFEQLCATKLWARIEGAPVKAYYRGIKAATFHNLVIEQYGDGLRTTIVFDI